MNKKNSVNNWIWWLWNKKLEFWLDELSDKTSDKIFCSLRNWDVWQVYEWNFDLNNPWIITTWWNVYKVWNWNSWPHKFPNWW